MKEIEAGEDFFFANTYSMKNFFLEVDNDCQHWWYLVYIHTRNLNCGYQESAEK